MQAASLDEVAASDRVADEKLMEKGFPESVGEQECVEGSGLQEESGCAH